MYASMFKWQPASYMSLFKWLWIVIETQDNFFTIICHNFKPNYNILNYTQSWWGTMVASHCKSMVYYFVNDNQKYRTKALVFFPLFCQNTYLATSFCGVCYMCRLFDQEEVAASLYRGWLDKKRDYATNYPGM